MTKINLSDYGYSILQIETIGSCNMACQFCPYPLRNDKVSKLDSSLVYQTIDLVNTSDPNFEYVTLSQFNEPLLDERIFEFYRYLRLNSIKSLGITNGIQLAFESVRKRLFDSPPDILKISLQTLNKKTFNLIRGTSVDPERYYDGIARFIANVDASRFNIIVDLACNFRSPINNFVSKLFGISTGEPSVESNPVHLSSDLADFIGLISRYNPRVIVDQDAINGFLLNASTTYGDSILVIHPGLSFHVKPFFYGRRISDYKPNTSRIRCGNRILGVLADGSVVPCCLAYDNSLSLGNIYELSLQEILVNSSTWINDLRSFTTLKSEVCRKCLGEPTSRGLVYRRIRSFASEVKSSLASSYLQ